MMFCLSGIILNHRQSFAEISLSRKYLPSKYHYHNWNNNLLRGTTRVHLEDKSEHSVLIYGASGLWLSDSTAQKIEDFNEGLPIGADDKYIRAVEQAPSGELFAAGQFNLYRRQPNKDSLWERVNLPERGEERITDITFRGEELILLTRSYIYSAHYPYQTFSKHRLLAPKDYVNKVSLFRTIWLLHSGELFGLVGKLFVDFIAILLIILCITGIIYWFMPNFIRSFKRKGKTEQEILHQSLHWHDLIGKKTIILPLFITFTGWCLRPPVLIALVQFRVPAVPYTLLDSTNPWRDKLRMIYYDDKADELLLSSSEGFYRLQNLDDTPQKIDNPPPVSLMGLNVFERVQGENDKFLIGSFQGLFIWDRKEAKSYDYFTGKLAKNKASSPFGARAISGYSEHFPKTCIVEYVSGTNAIAMPSELKHLPMSLWNIALEVHTGRIYSFFGKGVLLFVPISGLLLLWLLISGYKVRLKKKKEKGKKEKL